MEGGGMWGKKDGQKGEREIELGIIIMCAKL